jgi:hypothetical protein
MCARKYQAIACAIRAELTSYLMAAAGTRHGPARTVADAPEAVSREIAQEPAERD